jgi:outer membrane immunogenic protein
MRTRLAIVAAALAAASTANAADIAPTYKAPPAPVPVVYNWGGFYLGGNVGYAWANIDTNSSLSAVGPITFSGVATSQLRAMRGPLSLDDNNWTWGAQAGINVQTGAWVWGGEVDVNRLRFRATNIQTNALVAPAVPTPIFFTDDVSNSWLVTGRARLGYAFNNVLFYGTGGVAFANFRYRSTFRDPLPADNTGSDASGNKNGVGWVAGAGIEYGIGQWSLKAEYLYVDMGSTSFTGQLRGTIATDNVWNHTADLTAQIVRVGLNYRFGGDYGKAPVVAKY